MAIAVYNMPEAERNAYTHEKNRYFYVSVLNADGSEKERITPDKIESESFKLSMGVCSGNKLKFGLCEAAFVEFTCYNWPRNINGETIRVFQHYGENDIDFGKFIVTSCKREIATGARKITAYDALYSGNLDSDFSEIKSDIAPSNFPAFMLWLSSAANVDGIAEATPIEKTEKTFYSVTTTSASVTVGGDINYYLVVSAENEKTVEFVEKDRLRSSFPIFCKVEYDTDALLKLVDDINNEALWRKYNDHYTVADFIRTYRLGVCPYTSWRAVVSGEERFYLSLHFDLNGVTESGRDYYEYYLIFSNEVRTDIAKILDESREGLGYNGLAVSKSVLFNHDLRPAEVYNIVKNADFYEIRLFETIFNTFDDEQTAAIMQSFSGDGVTVREALEAVLELQGVFGSSRTAGNDNVIHLSDFSEKGGIVETHALVNDYVLNDRFFSDSRRYHASDIESCWYDDEEFRKTLSGVVFEYKANDAVFSASYTGNNGSGYYDLSENIVLRALCNAGLISTAELNEICERLYKKIQGVAWAETTISAEARPWVQAGERIMINDGSKKINTYVFEKNQTGNISMYDEIYSDGLEY